MPTLRLKQKRLFSSFLNEPCSTSTVLQHKMITHFTNPLDQWCIFAYPRTSNCREGTLGGLTSFVPVDDVREGDQMRAEMTSLFIGTNDVTPPSVPSLQFEVLVEKIGVQISTVTKSVILLSYVLRQNRLTLKLHCRLKILSDLVGAPN